MSLTQLVIGRVSATMYDLQASFPSFANLTSILLRDKKGIPRTTSMLVLVRKKVFSKNWTLSRLSWSKKLAEAIL